MWNLQLSVWFITTSKMAWDFTNSIEEPLRESYKWVIRLLVNNIAFSLAPDIGVTGLLRSYCYLKPIDYCCAFQQAVTLTQITQSSAYREYWFPKTLLHISLIVIKKRVGLITDLWLTPCVTDQREERTLAYFTERLRSEIKSKKISYQAYIHYFLQQLRVAYCIEFLSYVYKYPHCEVALH